MMKFYVPEISTVEQIVSEEEKKSVDVFEEVLRNNPQLKDEWSCKNLFFPFQFACLCLGARKRDWRQFLFRSERDESRAREYSRGWDLGAAWPKTGRFSGRVEGKIQNYVLLEHAKNF